MNCCRNCDRGEGIFQEVGARPWILGRRNGLACGICSRLKEDDRFSGKQILAEVHWRLNTLISCGGFSAYRVVFGSDPVDLYGREGKNGELTFAQDSSISDQCAQHWHLRMMARGAALRESANSGLR